MNTYAFSLKKNLNKTNEMTMYLRYKSCIKLIQYVTSERKSLSEQMRLISWSRIFIATIKSKLTLQETSGTCLKRLLNFTYVIHGHLLMDRHGYGLT